MEEPTRNLEAAKTLFCSKIPWQPDKFHAEHRVFGRRCSGLAIALRGGSVKPPSHDARIQGTMGPFAASSFLRRPSVTRWGV